MQYYFQWEDYKSCLVVPGGLLPVDRHKEAVIQVTAWTIFNGTPRLLRKMNAVKPANLQSDDD